MPSLPINCPHRLNKRQFVQQRIRQPLTLNFSILNDTFINHEPCSADRGHSIMLADAVRQPPGVPYMLSIHSPGLERSERKAVSLGGVGRPQEERARVGACAAVRRRAATMSSLRPSEKQTWVDCGMLRY